MGWLTQGQCRRIFKSHGVSGIWNKESKVAGHSANIFFGVPDADAGLGLDVKKVIMDATLSTI